MPELPPSMPPNHMPLKDKPSHIQEIKDHIRRLKDDMEK